MAEHADHSGVRQTLVPREEYAAVPAENPYLNLGSVITDPANFYGRKVAVADTIKFIKASQCVSIIGARRIGKTSLLKHISNPTVWTDHRFDPGQFLFAYVDAQGLGYEGPKDFYKLILEELYETILDPKAKKGLAAWLSTTPEEYKVFKDAIKEASLYDLKPVILFDEFEAMCTNKNLDRIFFDGLRALGNAKDVVYVTASKDSLRDLTKEHVVLSSGFFNIFWDVRILPFDEDEARELVVQPSSRSRAPFSEPTTDFILTLAGGHPYFLQITSHHAFDLKVNKQDLDRRDQEKLIGEAVSSLKSHLDSTWDGLTEPEQRVMYTWETAKTNPAYRYKILSLRDKAIITLDEDKYPMRCKLWDNYVEYHREIQAGELVQGIKVSPLAPTDLNTEEYDVSIDNNLKEKLVNALIETPGTSERSGRNALLSGIPSTIRSGLDRTDNQLDDLTNIVDQLDQLGLLDNGEWPLVILTQNASRKTKGSGLGRRLQQIEADIKVAYNLEASQPSAKVEHISQESKKSEGKSNLPVSPAKTPRAQQGLPSDLLQDLTIVLLECGPFGRYEALRAVFTDRRIAPWRNNVSDAASPSERVDLFVNDFLNVRDASQRCVLVLFLQALHDKAIVEGECAIRLDDIAVRVALETSHDAPPLARYNLARAAAVYLGESSPHKLAGYWPPPVADEAVSLVETLPPYLDQSIFTEALESLKDKEEADWLPLDFLKKGLDSSLAVGRVEHKGRAIGTGFLVSPDLILTNAHVMQKIPSLKEGGMRFGVELGAKAQWRYFVEEVERSPVDDLDFVLVRLERPVNAAPLSLSEENAYAEQTANILQYPVMAGGLMQVALRHNTIVRVDETRLYYAADTEHGSSGSPVFDDSWRVIGLHRAGMKDSGEEVVKNANQGVPIRCIEPHIRSHLLKTH